MSLHDALALVCRQAYRTLRSLLGYDPTAIPAGQSGYGAGSGAPDLMFGFLKHLWATHSRHDALHRCSSQSADCLLLLIVSLILADSIAVPRIHPYTVAMRISLLLHSHSCIHTIDLQSQFPSSPLHREAVSV